MAILAVLVVLAVLSALAVLTVLTIFTVLTILALLALLAVITSKSLKEVIKEAFKNKTIESAGGRGVSGLVVIVLRLFFSMLYIEIGQHRYFRTMNN